MYQTCKVYQVAKEMRRLELAILGVSEIRWTWAGKLHLTAEKAVLCSGQAGHDASQENGAGLILSKETGMSFKDWELISK